jgi:RNA polymerase sigma-70 factor (ECF subfamily)
MTQHDGCMNLAGRRSNAEFGALILGSGEPGEAASRQLYMAVLPLLIAFFEGQAQAGRIGQQDIGELLRATLRLVDRQRASYDPALPFRAWLLELARHELGACRRLPPLDAAEPKTPARRRRTVAAH